LERTIDFCQLIKRKLTIGSIVIQVIPTAPLTLTLTSTA
jgi:hypothetical protein